jgi:glycosyltransferase involved in cell wall biosynthesis
VNKPTLSFIVPSRNSNIYLKHTIKNLLDSKDQRYEVVLSLNNDHHQVPDWLSQLQDIRLKVFNSKINLSMSENWFRGLDKSKGIWVCFVGSDDGIVAANLTKFIDILELTNKEKVIINHNVAFHYATKDRPAHINRPLNSPTKKLVRIKWPIRLGALFPQFFYDMPQPYSKAIVNKKVLEPLLNHDREIPGFAPDVFLGNYVAMKTKFGMFYDELLTIRGNSILSIGGQIMKNKVETISAKEMISDTYRKASQMKFQVIFGLTCRPAITLDHYINSRNKLGKSHNISLAFGKFWCNLTCLDKSHHKPVWNKLLLISKIIYSLGLLLRKIWVIKNFGFISKDYKEVVSKKNSIFTISKFFSDKFNQDTKKNH